MNDARKSELIKVYRDGLLNDTMPFWESNCVDRAHGGFMMSLGQDGTVIDTDKCVWQQGRFTWLLGKLFNNVEPNENWISLAKHGARFLDKHCFDPSDGRMWFHLNQHGQPIRKRRYAFSESFAAIAYGEIAKSTQSAEFADKAQKTFQRFVDHNLNPTVVEPKFTNTRPMRGIGFPMITIGTAQELRDSIGLETANHWIDKSIDDILKFHLKPELTCVMESVGNDGEIIDSFEGRLLNPGHAIEAAWFIMREGKFRSDENLIQTGCRMLDWMWQRGWDSEYGGILYFRDLYDRPIQEYWHDMKFWWPQNETIIATLMAWQLTGDEKYSRMHQQIHDWTYSHFPDHENGEWFGYLHRDGRISSRLKGNLWKGPFHLPRMQLICWKLLEEH